MILGIGVDIIEIARIKDKLEVLAKKVLSSSEYQSYLEYGKERQLEFVAGRIAAKEAVFKSLPKAKHFSTLELVRQNDKLYYIEGKIKVHISISHEKNYAVAYALAEEIC